MRVVEIAGWKIAIRFCVAGFCARAANGHAAAVLRNELGTGSVDAEGKVHATSTWGTGGMVIHGDYAGTLTPSGER
jgi:hypothetical protein